MEIKECFYDNNEEEPYFAVNTENGWGVVNYDAEMYNKIAETYKEQIKDDNSCLVDLDWAFNVLENES